MKDQTFNRLLLAGFVVFAAVVGILAHLGMI